MIRAEHSPQNHSAPYGASRVLNTPVSLANPSLKSCSRANNLPVDGLANGLATGDSPAGILRVDALQVPQNLALTEREFLVGLSRRRSFSGRALMAVLSLGLLLEAAPGAHGVPAFTHDNASAMKNQKDWEFGFETKKLVRRAKSLNDDLRVASAPSRPRLTPAAALAPRTLTLTPRSLAPRTLALTARTKKAPATLLPTIPAQKASAMQNPAVKVSQKLAESSSVGGGKMIRFTQLTPPQTASRLLAPRLVLSKNVAFKTFTFKAVNFKTVPTKATVTRTQVLQQVAQVASFRVVPLAPARITSVSFAKRTKPAVLVPIVAPQSKPVYRLAGMKKVIDVPTLSLPPLSQPLPRWMQNAAVKIDRLEKKAPTRLAQNPGAAPVRNPAAPVTNSDRLPNQIEVAVSTFVVLLTTTDLQTVAVADPTIADVAVVNSRSVLLNGKAAGVTSLVIVDGQKIRQYTVRVTASPGSRPVDIAAAIGIPGVSVRPLKDALVLEGEVGSAEEARRATEIAGIYSPKVVNQLSIRGQVSQEAGNAAQLRDLIGLPNVNVRVVGDTAVLSGTVDSPQQIQDADIIARTVAKNVINQLRLPAMTPEQVRQSLGAVPDAPVSSLYVPGQLQTSSPLSVREAGGQLVLEGTVANQAEVDIALAAAGRTGLPIMNRIQVRPGATADQTFVSQVVAAIGRPGVIVRGTPKRLILEGTVSDTNEAVLVEQVARAFVQPSIGQVDNMLRTANPVQCNVDVSIIEINSTDARNLGVEYGSSTLLSENESAGIPATLNPVTNLPIPGTGTPGGVTRTIDPAFRPGVGLVGGRFAGLGATQILDPLRARINALATQGKARILSNPRTTVLSGRTATFQVGGQVPIPSGSTTNASGTSTSIVFKDYGILLDIVPNALRNGNMTLRVRTEVSQPDFGTGITPPGGGSPIPGFSRRSTITEVTVPINGTVALSGLISADESVTTSSVPILSKIPIIGSLFRSRNFRNNQSELVIFVKPRVLPNTLPADSDAFAGVVAAGENTNVAAQMGNPGLRTFDSGASVSVAPQAQ